MYRYEAYLIGAAIATIACAVPYFKISRDKWQAAALSLLALAGIVLMTQRTVEAAASLPERSNAIYSQQVQMALFMKKYEEGAVVAANDVGAITFLRILTAWTCLVWATATCSGSNGRVCTQTPR